jgi:hypothetical protein
VLRLLYLAFWCPLDLAPETIVEQLRNMGLNQPAERANHDLITSMVPDSSGRVTVTVAIKRGEPSNSSSNYTLTLAQYGGSSWLIENVTAT